MNNDAEVAKALLLDRIVIDKEDILGMGVITHIEMSQNMYAVNYSSSSQSWGPAGTHNTTITMDIPGYFNNSINSYDEIMIIRRHKI